MSDLVVVALITGAANLVGIITVGAITYATNRTGALTHDIVNSQRTAMEVVIANLRAETSAKNDAIRAMQQQLHDSGAVTPPPL